MKFIISFPDPLYSYIRATKLEKLIIDFNEFQRMKRIKQLGVAQVVFPGAVHTRFEHCLGTMHVADLIFQRFQDEYGPKYEEYRQKLRLAGLLHDIGHSPFSHTFGISLNRMRDLTGFQYKTHEANTRAIISNFGKRAVFKKFLNELRITENPIEYFKVISKIATGKLNGLKNKDKFLSSIISGEIDADRLDYLMRDGLHTGVNFIGFNLHQLLENISMNRTKDRLIIGRKGEYRAFHETVAISLGEAILISRYHHYTYLVNHKKNIIANHMIIKAFINAIENYRKIKMKKNPMEYNETLNNFFKKYDDNDFLNFILKYGDSDAKNIIDNIKSGTLYWLCMDLKNLSLKPPIRLSLELQKRNPPIINEIESEICKIVDPHKIHICNSFIKGVPKNLRIRLFKNDSFLYDESKLTVGLIKEIVGSNSFYILCETKKDASICNKLIRDNWGKVEKIILEKTNNERKKNPFRLDFLLLFLNEFNKYIVSISESLTEYNPSKYMFRYITRIYKMINWIQENYSKSCSQFSNPFDYKFNQNYGYIYSPELFEDLMKLYSIRLLNIILYEYDRLLSEQKVRKFNDLDYIRHRAHIYYKFYVFRDGRDYCESIKTKYKEYINFINSNIPYLYNNIYI